MKYSNTYKFKIIRNPIWKTNDGRMIPIMDLDDDHLENIIVMLITGIYNTKKGIKELKWSPFLRLGWILVLSEEMIRRNNNNDDK